MPKIQAIHALVLLLLGLAFGLALDLYRVLRRLSNPGPVITACCDILFWLAYTVWVYATLVQYNRGEVRFYVFACLGLGGLIYSVWFSRSVIRVYFVLLSGLFAAVSWLAETVNRLLDVVLSIVLWPYRVLTRFIIHPLCRLICFLLQPLVALTGWLKGCFASLGAALIRPLRALWQRIAHLINPPPENS
ncbi:MAG: spore cortex biosynthesis protein YabQ [Bacillota bacterium]|jgi:spore cortex biosynthesis protein YabQ